MEKRNMKHNPLIFFIILTIIPTFKTHTLASSDTSLITNSSNNETIHKDSKQLCYNCMGQYYSQSMQFLYAHNLVRAAKKEPPLIWDYQLEKYAMWWAGQRRADCQVAHSFPEGGFTLGENIYWGSGATWTPVDAVRAWVDEERYYSYKSNSCAQGKVCGHYTQIVWRDTRRVGCARVVCDTGDVFMTCNYYPPGNYVGQRPY